MLVDMHNELQVVVIDEQIGCGQTRMSQKLAGLPVTAKSTGKHLQLSYTNTLNSLKNPAAMTTSSSIISQNADSNFALMIM